MADAAANRRGILATLAAVSLWTVNDTCSKLAAEVFPPGEMMAVRGVFAIAIAVAVVAGTGHARMLWHGAAFFARPMVLLRGALDAGIVFCFLKAITNMQLADATAISLTTPIVMTLLAAAFGIERIGWRRFLAISVGFLGMLLIVKPSTDGLTIYAAYAVLSAVLVAIRDLMTRYIDPRIPSAVIALATAIAGCLAGLLLGLSESWEPVLVPPTLYLIAAGVFVTFGNLAIVIAYRDAEVGVIAPFRYFSILIALVLGYGVFGTLPDATSFAGIALIMGSGLYTMHREQVRRREAEALAGRTAPALAAKAGEAA